MTLPSSAHDELWERIQTALDQRLDPLDDPQLAAAIAEAPDLAQELVLLLESLQYLTPRPMRARRSAALLALAAALLLAWGTWRLAPQLEAMSRPTTADSRAPAPLALRTAVAKFELIIEHQGPAGLRRLVHNNDGLRTEFESGPAPPWLRTGSASSPPMQITAGDVITYEHTTVQPLTH